jgi:membrane-associated phospholipid phosphatase
MEAIWQWGIDLIRTIQLVHGPALDIIFKVITFIGNQVFFFILFPLLFWCVDFALGARLAFIFLISAQFNSWLKSLFAHPRPFELDPTVKLYYTRGYGLPSGHSQSAVVVWGTIAARLRKTWFWFAAILLMVLIGFSRIYLGVHFPTDVLVGWTIGAVFLAAYLTLGARIETWLKRASPAVQLTLAVAVPLALLLIHPTDYTANPMAVLMGVGVGITLAMRTVPFSAAGPFRQRAARFLIGAAVLLILYFVPELAPLARGEPFHFIVNFVRCALMGLWITLGAPWVFLKLQLASSRQPVSGLADAP